MHAHSSIIYIYLVCLPIIMGGFVISCDSEDTNRSEMEENGREREVGEGWEGQGPLLDAKST